MLLTRPVLLLLRTDIWWLVWALFIIQRKNLLDSCRICFWKFQDIGTTKVASLRTTESLSSGRTTQGGRIIYPSRTPSFFDGDFRFFKGHRGIEGISRTSDKNPD